MDERNRLGSRGVLYIISCASRPAQRVQDLVIMAQVEGWDVCVIATPQATKFVGIPLLEQLTGHPVRSEYKRPEEPDVLPRADAIVVFLATFNTLNKRALGIADTLALGLLLSMKKSLARRTKSGWRADCLYRISISNA